jgi:hypothetical protein
VFDDAGCLCTGNPSNPVLLPPGTRIYAVMSEPEEQTLTLYTRSRGWGGPDADELSRMVSRSKGKTGEPEFIDLRFTQVKGHLLDGWVVPVGLVTVTRLTPELLLYEWDDEFARRRDKGWPFEYVDDDDLCGRLEEMGAFGYGLTGWNPEGDSDEAFPLGFIIAEAAEYRHRQERATLVEKKKRSR